MISSANKIVGVVKSGRMRWARNVVGKGERRGAYRVLVGKLEGERPVGETRCRWIRVKRIFTKVGWGCMVWIDVAEDRDRLRAVLMRQ
jgi:hypothetical protein